MEYLPADAVVMLLALRSSVQILVRVCLSQLNSCSLGELRTLDGEERGRLHDSMHLAENCSSGRAVATPRLVAFHTFISYSRLRNPLDLRHSLLVRWPYYFEHTEPEYH